MVEKVKMMTVKYHVCLLMNYKKTTLSFTELALTLLTDEPWPLKTFLKNHKLIFIFNV